MDIVTTDIFGATSAIESAYWWVASISTGLFILLIIMNFAGLDFDHDFDLDIGVGDVSMSAILAFLCVGGWMGVLGYKTKLPVGGIFIFALVSGMVALVATAFMMKKMKGLEKSGNLNKENAVGTIGTVYLGIPAQRNGTGQVQIVVQGRLQTLYAATEGKNDIPTGDKVLVYNLDKEILLVEPYNN
jgi:membrane protein implicated in regulation of membrane protease activity